MDLKLIAQHLVPALRVSLRAPGLCLTGLDGGRPLDDEQREPWIKIKYGVTRPDDWVGVVPATARFVRARGAPQETLDLIVKVNPRQGLARNLIPWIAARNHVVLDRPFLHYRTAAELDRTAERELHVYELAGKMNVLREVLPRCYGWAHDGTGEHALFLECLTGVERLDATGASADWPPDAIDAALRVAARWQAAFWGANDKSLAWAGPRPTTAAMVADTSLWRGLLNDARSRFPHIITQNVWRRRYALIETMSDWHKVKDALPATLAHNDFNQRNVGFRTAMPPEVDARRGRSRGPCCARRAPSDNKHAPRPPAAAAAQVEGAFRQEFRPCTRREGKWGASRRRRHPAHDAIERRLQYRSSGLGNRSMQYSGARSRRTADVRASADSRA